MNSEFKDRDGKPIIGLHIKRGMLIKNEDDNMVRRSMRKGSGKRKHLGDGITNTGTSPNELADRMRALKE